jgi:hypothetical protein
MCQPRLFLKFPDSVKSIQGNYLRGGTKPLKGMEPARVDEIVGVLMIDKI